MVFQVNKKKSKRQTCRTRYKIEKKVRDHNKKLRKLSNKKGKKGLKKKEVPLELQIPNKCPFKEEMLLAAKNTREQKEQEKVQRREELKELRKAARQKEVLEKRATKTKTAEKGVEKAKTLESLVEGAEKRQASYEFESVNVLQANDQLQANKSNKAQSSVKAYASEVRKVLESADVVIEVLDARDPLGSRCEWVEKQVIGEGKRLVLLLNKIDLVPKKNVEAWLKYLRNQLPTIAFKASTQEQKHNLGRAGANMSTQSSKCLGAEMLMKILGNYCRNQDIKTSIRVGIIGFPNVGKSSVINSLKRTRTCNVGAMPGITKLVQEVELDKHVKLLDSPGVVLAQKGSLDSIEIALRNAVRVENIEDPVAPVEAILRRCSRDTLMLQYGIPSFEDSQEFLKLIARKNGKVLKGARPDINAAARRVLQDWNTGKLKYYTQPPEEEPIAPEYISSELVTTMGKEFSIEDIGNEQSLIVQGLSSNVDAALYQPEGDGDAVMDETDSADVKKDLKVVVEASLKEKVLDIGMEDDPMAEAMTAAEAAIPGNQQLSRKMKMRLKKKKKKDLRAGKLGAKLGDALTNAMELDSDSGEDYNFESDFTPAK